MTTHEIPSTGALCMVAPVPSVCEYLHGATGTIVGSRFSRIDGCTVYELQLDEPRAPAENWPAIDCIGLRPDQLRIIRNEAHEVRP